MAAKLGCHGNDSVDEHVMTTLIYSQIILVKVAKFGKQNNNFIGFMFSTKQSI